MGKFRRPARDLWQAYGIQRAGLPVKTARPAKIFRVHELYIKRLNYVNFVKTATRLFRKKPMRLRQYPAGEATGIPLCMPRI